ncbi:probable serine/threonine-protein kinase DDB_G0267686 isoform X2 [Drosophila sulfurigaster albostrigata]|uniref:probable serine/threonine-protein kinase DDB_G0267686 isoform X2 n=1 Tax=Drosophila sulfurigaster albostrigata TaxID=89887 RepID=UPI002D21854C|nr:probable serine/threonine-protein kinase DDB_G0267686 isoform X2 [Drosophila sulfurigaster albostrigata]
MLWFHKFYMLNKKNAEERIGRKTSLLSKAQVKRSNSIVIPSKPADQQGSNKVRVAPRSQSLVNRPEMRRRNAPASSLAAEPCMMDFVSRIPKPHLTKWQKVKTDSMGNIYQMLDGMLQSSSILASSMPKLDVNPGPPEFDTLLNEASKDPELILFNKLLTEKSISQKESANNDAPKQEEFSNKNHSKQESVSNSALKLEVCSNNDASKQKCLNNNAPKYEEVSNDNGPKRESPNSNNSKQESLSNDASKQASLNNDASKQESSSNEDPKRKSPNNDAPKHQESSKIDASKHEESSNKDAPKQACLNNDASKQESTSNDALNQEEASNNSVLKQEPSEKAARKQKISDKVSPTTEVAAIDPRISREHLDSIVKTLLSSAADNNAHDDAIFELNERNNRLEEIVNKIRGYVADTSLNSNKILYKTRKTLYLYYKSMPELDHEF